MWVPLVVQWLRVHAPNAGGLSGSLMLQGVNLNLLIPPRPH